MLKTVIILPDGTELSSGPGKLNAVQKSTITECVNSGEELAIGSVCSNSFEATLITPAGGLSISAGDIIAVRKEDENGNRIAVGLFTIEKPTRPTANTMKIVGYDHVSILDKDLTDWLSGLTGWPYALNTFAEMVCDACGLRFSVKEIPNSSFSVKKFTRPSVTGRQIMRWLGEICCSFCRAAPSGEIEFAWYTPADAEITPTGDSFYFQNGLTYEDYSVAPIEAVQVRLADSSSGALWPSVGNNANSYVISFNPILTSSLDQATLNPVLNNIATRLSQATYTPCKVDMPATMNIRAGNTVQITDKNGVTFTAYVMTKTQTGQKETIECTGSARRDSSSAINNKTQAEKDAAMESVAQNAVNSQTSEDVLRRLTNDYQIQGIWQEDGLWYFNAQAVKVLNLVADLMTAGKLVSQNKAVEYDLNNGTITINGVKDGKKTKLVMSESGVAGYSENSSGEMEHTLDFCFGSNNRPSGLWNMSNGENTGLSIGSVYGELSIGETEAKTSICGDTIELCSIMLGAVITVGLDSLKILGKTVSWKSNGDGTFTLIGT